jgi:hypothetical protein
VTFDSTPGKLSSVFLLALYSTELHFLLPWCEFLPAHIFIVIKFTNIRFIILTIVSGKSVALSTFRAGRRQLTPIILVTWEAEIWRIKIWGQPRQIVWEIFPTLHFQNNLNKMDWRCGSSGRAPTLQVWDPEFKPQSNQKNKNKNYIHNDHNHYSFLELPHHPNTESPYS